MFGVQGFGGLALVVSRQYHARLYGERGHEKKEDY